jgi:hypothetical protein
VSFPCPRGWLAGVSLHLPLREGFYSESGSPIFYSAAFFSTPSYQDRVLPSAGVIASSAVLLTVGAGLWLLFPYTGKSWLVCIVAINALILGLFFWERARRWFFITFAVLLIINGAAINPVMSGLAPLLESNAFRAVKKIHAADPSGRWIAYENVGFAQMAKATGASVLNGTKIVPDLKFLHELDSNDRSKWVYNRYAYINVDVPDQRGGVAFDYNFGVEDAYQIRLPPELPLLHRGGYRYVMFPQPWLNPGAHEFSLLEEIEPTGLYIYKSNAD